jgi:hypothetical protein
MPPWGKGPVQGKIHGHPEYIEENFPKTDKFLHCKVERMGHKVSPKRQNCTFQAFRTINGPKFLNNRRTRLSNMKMEIPEKTVTHKGDGTTDEEEFQKQRNERLSSPQKGMDARELMGSSIDAVAGGGLGIPIVFVALGMLLMGTLALRGGRKIRSKSN